MSLPLWEECAWYVDIPEPELELTEPAEAPEDAFDGAAYEDEDYSAEINIDITSDAGDAVESTAVDASTLESEFQAALGGYVADAADAVPDEISEPLPDHQDSEQLPDTDAEVTSQVVVDHGETAEDAEVEQSEHAVDAADEAQEFEEDEQNFDISVNIVDEDGEPVEEPVTYRFPINKHINKRMYLYLGEIYKLPCDAIVVGQVENLRDKLDGNDVIFTLAGIELEPELAQLAPCTTGDCVVTKGWQMPCEWIIHAVGPKYDARYLEASDHALFSAYKKSLLLAAEKEVQSLVFGTIYKQSKNYPRFDAAHVALRTVRKFLEHSVGDNFDRVMFCVNTQEDFEIYSALMHAYFPRTQEELEDQANLLPIELGDEWGEIIIPDRVVKVSVGPKPLPVESLQQYKGASEEAKDTTPGGAAAAGPKKLGKWLVSLFPSLLSCVS
jgi:O-acetyl-ADP-ribose deacetylase (regulator of RNase III)